MKQPLFIVLTGKYTKSSKSTNLYKKIYSCIFFLAFICTLSYAQSAETSPEPITLSVQQAVVIALEHNISLQIAQLDIKSQQHIKSTNWNNFVPSVVLGSALSRNNGNSGLFESAKTMDEKDRWGLDLSLNASWTLSSSAFFTFQKNIRDYENGLDTYQNAVLKLERDVQKAFYDILLKQEDIRIGQLSLQNAEKKYTQDAANYKKGVVSEMVLLKSQLAYENAKTDMSTKIFTRDVALDSFRALLGLPQGESLVLTGQIEILPKQFNAEQLIADYLYNRVDVKTQLNTLNELSIAKTEAYVSAYAPTFSASYGITLNGILNQDSFNFAKNLMDTGALNLRISIPLDSFIPGTKTNNTFYNRQIQIEKQTLSVQQTVENAINDISNTVNLLNRSSSILGNLLLNEKIAQRSYDLTFASYQRGETDYQSVLDAQTALESAKQRISTEQFSYLSRLLDLEFSLNTKLQ